MTVQKLNDMIECFVFGSSFVKYFWLLTFAEIDVCPLCCILLVFDYGTCICSLNTHLPQHDIVGEQFLGYLFQSS